MFEKEWAQEIEWEINFLNWDINNCRLRNLITELKPYQSVSL